MYSIEEVVNYYINSKPLPPMLIKAINLIKDEKTSLSKIGRLIASDPVLTAKFLNLCNSPYYGLKSKVTNVPYAISLLGLETTHNILMEIASKSIFVEGSPLYDPKEIRKHSLLVARLMRIFARNRKLPFLLDGYTIGILHDIGQLAISIAIDEETEKLINEKLNQGYELDEAEREVLSFDHAEASYLILKKFKIPEKIAEPVRTHHFPIEKDFNSLNFLLSLSDTLSDIYELDDDSINSIVEKKHSVTIDEIESELNELKIDAEFLEDL